MNVSIRFVLFLGFLGLFHALPAAAGGPLWRDLKPAESIESLADPDLPRRYRLLELDTTLLEEQLTPWAESLSAKAKLAPVVIDLPLPEGGFRSFSISPSAVMAPELAAKYPEIQTYSGAAVDDPRTRVSLDWTPLGLHAMVSSPRGVFYIDPRDRSGSNPYLCFDRKDAKRMPRSLAEPDFIDRPGFNDEVSALLDEQQGVAIGDQLRTYRLAVATTAGYTRYFGNTKKRGLAAVATAVNRVNLIYEEELAIRLQLVRNNEKVIFVDQDPYGGLKDDALLMKNQEVLDLVIGSGNYDLGHIFLDVPAGLASVGSVCVKDEKAQGQTGAKQPHGDPFWVDYVAHEMGHQLGAAHTFNSETGGCGKGNRAAMSAFEIGSGITIMGYAGLCDADNIAKNSIPFFHVRSFEQITQNVRVGTGKCGTDKPTGNGKPTVDAGSGRQTIPMKTMFHLAGSGTDPRGLPLTYSWEQYDLGAPATLVQTKKQSPTLGTVPTFRSFAPQTDVGRFFPRLADSLNGRSSDKEVLPGYSRDLQFRLTVRNGLGGVASSAVRTFSVTQEAGPFAVKEPGKHAVWKSNEQGRVTWDVARTDQPPVSCGAVNVYLSTDGGKAFTPIATEVPNKGQTDVNVPSSLATKRARVLIACSNSIFGDVSDANFTISP